MRLGTRKAVRVVVLLAITPVLIIIFLVIATVLCWGTFSDTMKDLLKAWCDGLMECLRCDKGEER